MRNYLKNVQLAKEDMERYWENMFQRFTWFKKYSKVLDESDANFPKWFPDGEMSIIYECLDKHVNDDIGDDIAFIFESFYTKLGSQITYKELLVKVSRLAGYYHEKGVKKQDHVLLFLPTTLECVVSMLAASRLGAVYTVLYGGFSDESIADRIHDFKPKIIVTANDDFDLGHSTPMKELMDKAIQLAGHKPDYCLIWQRPHFKMSAMVPGRDFDLLQAIEEGKPRTFTPVEVNQPFYVVYTSGTTGKPKGIVHCTRGLAAAIIHEDGFIINPDIGTNKTPPVSCFTSNFAWIAGQFAGCYMPLLYKIPSLLYEGAIKDVEPEDIYHVLSTYKVTSCFISTTGVRGIMANDPHGNKAEAFKPFNLKMLLNGGATGDVPTITWAQKIFSSPVVQLYGQTELGGIITSFDVDDAGQMNIPLLSVGKTLPGINLKIIKEDGSEAKPEESGRIMIKMPLPPIMMVTILNNDQLFVKDMLTSCKGFYDLKDDGKFDAEGNLFVICRSDSVFRAAGHRISCTGIEEAMMSHLHIAECLVVTKPVTKNGDVHQIPEGFFVLKKGVTKSSDEIAKELVTIVHKQIGSFIPLSPPHRVNEFPKTASGKISRSVVEQLVRNPNEMAANVNSDPVLKSLWECMRVIRG